jgi:hypothetical protein
MSGVGKSVSTTTADEQPARAPTAAAAASSLRGKVWFPDELMGLGYVAIPTVLRRCHVNTEIRFQKDPVAATELRPRR